MAEKSKTYQSAKIPYEVIAEALERFIKSLDSKTKKSLSGYWEITYPDCTWQFDNKDQFAFEYKKEDILNATLRYFSFGIKFSVRYEKNIYSKPSTQVSIALPNRDDIEKLFSIFESNYKEIIAEIKNGKGESEKILPHYSITKILPSEFVDKELLVELERYIIKRASQLDADAKNQLEKFQVTVKDSSGTLYLKRIESYPRDLFDNGTEYISLKYGESYSKLEIFLKLSKSRENTELEISYHGESARENVESIKLGIFKLLRDSRTWNAFYHPAWGLKVFLSMVFITLISIQIGLAISKHTLFQILIATSLLFTVYLLAPHFKPYSTFMTRQNISIRKWSGWLVETLLAILLTWFLALVLSWLFPQISVLIG